VGLVVRVVQGVFFHLLMVLGVDHGMCHIGVFESPVVVVDIGKMHWEGLSGALVVFLGWCFWLW